MLLSLYGSSLLLFFFFLFGLGYIRSDLLCMALANGRWLLNLEFTILLLSHFTRPHDHVNIDGYLVSIVLNILSSLSSYYL